MQPLRAPFDRPGQPVLAISERPRRNVMSLNADEVVTAVGYRARPCRRFLGSQDGRWNVLGCHTLPPRSRLLDHDEGIALGVA
jgi:hypothetical protein